MAIGDWQDVGARLDGSARFKHAFRRYPSGVALVTAMTDEGPFGLTASSVASVSADPPVLSFSVSSGSPTARQILAASAIEVHLLPASLVGLAEAFARTGAPRFTDEQGWERDGAGGLHLPGALATLTGSPRVVLPVGAATLVVLDVRSVSLGATAEPLGYHDREFRGLGRVLRAEGSPGRRGGSGAPAPSRARDG